VVDPQANLICVGQKETRVGTQLIALLCYLVENKQQIVSRQQITAAVWPNVVVEEGSISRAIFSLRNVLGDDAKQPKFIETIPKKGFRFLAEVSFLDANINKEIEVHPPVDPTGHTTPSVNKAHKAKAILGITILLGLLGVLAAGWYEPARLQKDEILNILPATKLVGVEGDMAINGNHKMAFLNFNIMRSDLYLKDLTTGAQERITYDNWQKGPPRWLNDNTLIYSRCSMQECQIVSHVLNQSTRVLYTAKVFLGDIALIPGDPHSFIFGEGMPSQLISFDTRSGKYEKLRNRYNNLPEFMNYLLFSKDNSHLYFVTLNDTGSQEIIMEYELSTKKIRTISNQFDSIQSITFDRHQQILVSGEVKHTKGLWLLNTTDGTPTLFLRATTNESFPRALAAPGEPYLYVQSLILDWDIGLKSGGIDIAHEFPDLNSTGMDASAILTDDEQFIYFVSDRTGFSEIWRYDIAKKIATQITQLRAFIFLELVISHDGQRIAALYNDEPQRKMGIFSIHTGELLASKDTKVMVESWSNDDQFLYVADFNDNRDKLMRYNSHTLEAVEIQTAARLIAHESADGRSLAFVDYKTEALIERNLTTGEDTVAIDKIPQLHHISGGQARIDAKGESMLAIVHKQETHQLFQYPLKKSAHKLSNPIKPTHFAPDDTVTYINGDGTKLLYDKLMPTSGDMMKIELGK
jgi:DNA-binding winged helix-turn-helix (wHTH) protein